MVHALSSLRVAAHLGHVTPKQTQPSVPAGSNASQPQTFSSWFPGVITGGPSVPVPDPVPPDPAPTAESVFGPDPWISNPTGMGPNGVPYSYNPFYFATPQTAAKVAQMVGGTVVQSYSFTPNGGAFAQQQATQMVRLPDGRMINPGLVASFYTHGYPQSYIKTLIDGEVKNA